MKWLCHYPLPPLPPCDWGLLTMTNN